MRQKRNKKQKQKKEGKERGERSGKKPNDDARKINIPGNEWENRSSRRKKTLVGRSYCPDIKEQNQTGSEGEVCGVELLSKRVGRQRGKNSIPFSQFLRLRRLCSVDADFEEKAEEMANFFLQRQYPENTVKKAHNQVRPIPRQKNTAAQQQNGRRRETDHESPLPPLDYPRAQNHPVELESPASTH